MKAWFKSKMIWLNLFALLVNLAELAAALLPAMEMMLTVEQFMVFNGTVTAVNIFLRFITDKGIFVRKPSLKVGGSR